MIHTYIFEEREQIWKLFTTDKSRWIVYSCSLYYFSKYLKYVKLKYLESGGGKIPP